MVHLAYAEAPDGRPGPYQVRYARRADESREFEPARVISGPNREGEGAAFPSLALGAANRIYVIWDRCSGARDRPRAIVLSWSEDGGETFTAPAVVPGSEAPPGGYNGSLQGLLMDKLAAAPAGELSVVSSSLVPDRQSRIRLIRGHAP